MSSLIFILHGLVHPTLQTSGNYVAFFDTKLSNFLSFSGMYSCPCYYFPNRAGGSGRQSLVVAVDLKGGAGTSDHWVKRGTALLMSLDHYVFTRCILKWICNFLNVIFELILHWLKGSKFCSCFTGWAKKMLPLLIHTQILKMNIYSKFFFTDV